MNVRPPVPALPELDAGLERLALALALFEAATGTEAAPRRELKSSPPPPPPLLDAALRLEETAAGDLVLRVLGETNTSKSPF